MKLINDFFTVTEIDDSQEDLKFKVRMNPAHPIYQVHFLEIPLPPAFVWSKWQKRFLRIGINAVFCFRRP